MENGMLVRRATELDEGNVFIFEGRAHRVLKVQAFFVDPVQGSFQSFLTVNVITGEIGASFLRASTLVNVVRA